MLGHYYKVTISIWDDRITHDGLIFIANVYSFVTDSADSELRRMHDAFNTRLSSSQNDVISCGLQVFMVRLTFYHIS